MFDFVRRNTRLFQFILLILILPSFALVGMQGYTSFMSGGNAVVATVDGQKITQGEWDNTLREQTNRIRNQNPNIDPKLFDTPEVKKEALEVLVRERVIQAAAERAHFVVSKEHVSRTFWIDPQFAALRTADGKVNDAVLAAQGMSFEGFGERLRRDMITQQVTQPILRSAMVSSSAAALAFDALLQQREVRLQRFAAKDFAGKIEPSDAEIEAFYKDAANAEQFKLPESAQIQYVVLDLDALKKDLAVNEDDLKKYYDENASRFNQAEERRASHILISAEKSAPAAERSKAKSKAEELLAQARKNPAGFAELASKSSDDKGSAANGGDLDFFARNGAMVKPFEDATFALKQGEISNVIESDFGFHIIQLTAIRGGDKKDFAQVRPQIEADVRKQLAQKRFTEVAEQFSNMVYEQPDSLQPVADKLKLALQTASVQRTPAPGAAGPLASAKLLEAVFANDSLQAKHNSNAVETAPSQMVSARVVQYNPARLQALADVKPKVRELLVAKLASAQAVKAGQERLAALQKGGADAAGLEAPLTISRARPGELPRKVLEKLLSADATKLPTYAGVDVGDGSFVVAQIDKIEARNPAIIDAKRADQQYSQAWAAAETQAYYNALKTRFKATIKAAPAASAGTATP